MDNTPKKPSSKRIRNLLKKIIDSHAYIEKSLDDLPQVIEEHIKRIIHSAFKPEDITKFVIKELFDIYVMADGKKVLKEHYKGKPKELMNLLLTMNDLATKLLEIETSKINSNPQQGNNGVVVQFYGMNNPQPNTTKIDAINTPTENKFNPINNLKKKKELPNDS